jgi:hypothetical protein
VAAALTGSEAAATLRLAPQLDLRQGSGAHWWQLMHYLAALLQPGGEHPSSGLHTAMLEDHVLAMLLRVAWAPATVSRAHRPRQPCPSCGSWRTTSRPTWTSR